MNYFGEQTFDPMVGADHGRKTKPDPTMALDILAQWNLNPAEVLFVGDSETDVQTALNAGLQCIGCLWGFRSKEQLIAAGADVLIDHPRQLMDSLG